MAETWDYIVVGAGSAGCVVANRLSERGDLRVLVLEAGPKDWSPYLHIPVGRMRLNVKYDWDYPAEPDPTRNNRVERWERGKVLGGSSSINGTEWDRGNRADFDEWAKLGCVGWDFESVLPYFKKAETFEGGPDEYRGENGPMHVSFQHHHHPLIDTFVEAAKNAGEPFNPDYNGVNQLGVAYGQVNQKRGRRASSALAYLRPAMRRRNVRVITNAMSRRVIIEDGRAVGVEFERNGTIRTVRCQREVILSAGTIGSPALLLHSGIGPAKQLHELGITVNAELPGVGQHMVNHFGLPMFYEVNVSTLNREFTPWKVVKHALNFVFRGRGAATSAPYHAQVFSTVDGGDRPDYKIGYLTWGQLVKKSSKESDRHKLRPTPVNSVTVQPGVLHPKLTGAISLRSSDPNDPPVIDHPIGDGPENFATLRAAMRRTRQIMATAPMGDHVVREIQPGSEIQSDAELDEWIRKTVITTKHTCGTCKMGVDEMAVVDPELRVRGIGGLRVIDASVMPEVTSGGPNSPTIMIAERASDLILSAV